MRPHRFSTALVGCAVAFLCDVSMTFSPSFPEALAQEIKALKRVRIRDANNKNVGIILSFGVGVSTQNCLNAQTIALEVGDEELGINETYSLPVCADGFAYTEGLFFKTADCTGQAYFNGDSTDSLVPRSSVWRHGGAQTLYVEPSTPVSSDGLGVLSRSTGAKNEPDCAPESAQETLWEAIPVLDLLTVYQPPFVLD